jgi:hypothetical protein
VKLTVQVVVHADDQTEPVVREVGTVHRESLAGDTLGLQLTEAIDLLAAVQDSLVSHQVSTALSAQVGCPDCGAARRHKDSQPLVIQGQPAPGDEDSAGQAASGQSALVALRLPTSDEQNVQPLGRDTPRADQPRSALARQDAAGPDERPGTGSIRLITQRSQGCWVPARAASGREQEVPESDAGSHRGWSAVRVAGGAA